MAHLEKTQERDFPARARLRDRYFLRVVQDVLHDLRELRAGREGEVSGIDAEELWSWEDIILDNQAAAVVAGGVETHHGIDLPPVVVLLTRRARAPARAEAAGHVDPAPRALRCHAFNDAAARGDFFPDRCEETRARARIKLPLHERRAMDVAPPNGLARASSARTTPSAVVSATIPTPRPAARAFDTAARAPTSRVIGRGTAS